MIKTLPNNGQIEMAAQRFADYSALITKFISVDRDIGGDSATSFGQER